jgi:hypothetical protein
MLSQARRRTQASSASDALTRIGAPSSAVLPVSKADGTQRTLSAMEYLSSGTLLKRMKVCGNPRCYCASDPAARHGPYFEWSYLKAGKLHWVWQTSSSPDARLGLLCLLKAFPILGRFATPEDIPPPIVAHTAERAGLKGLTLAAYPKRTRARHRAEIRCYLGVHAWSSAAQTLVKQTMECIVGGRTHLSDLVNGAIEALVTPQATT